MKTIRIFISSPGDVVEERERAREVVESLRRRYAGRLWLKPVLWEDLPLQADASFQEGIDVMLDLEGGVDVGVFILWSRMGELQDGGTHRSGTEREFLLLREARQRSGGQRPALLVYARADDAGFAERLRGRSTAEQRELLEQKALVERFIEETFQDAETGRNLRAFHRFDRPQTFSQRLRAHLSELLDELAGDASGAGVVWDVESQGSPFMGLEAFGAEQAEVFFGREHEVLEGRRMLKEHACDGCAFLLVTGASGSGKSSLARAGLLPEVAAHEVDETVAQWRSLVVMPGELGEDPVAGLVARMGSAGVLPELCAEGVDVGEVVAGLKRDALTTVNLSVKRAAAEAGRTADGAVRVLLLVDQLEEAFGWSREARETFFGVLEAMARSGVVWVVVTVRGDFLGEVHESDAMGRLLSGQSMLTVLSPGPDALRRMIEEPARLAGLRFEEQDGRHLGERILVDAARHADLLPLVEFVLLRLYEQRDEGQDVLTFAAYEAMGGVEGALSRHAEHVFSGMGDEERDALATVLKRLVTLGEARGGTAEGAERVLRQRVELEDFGSKETAARRLVDALVAARLLTATDGYDVEVENRAGTGTVTVVHEALLRVWPRASMWVEGNRELLRVRARVAGRMEQQRTGVISEGDPLLEAAKVHLAADFEAFSRDQQQFIERSVTAVDDRRRKRERTRRAVMAGMSALTLAALAGAVMAWTKQQEAETERERATAAERNLEKQLVETQLQFERWQLVEGRAWLDRARVVKSEGNHLSALLYAGRAVGFHGFGRSDVHENKSTAGSYPSLLGARFTNPAFERERIRDEAEVCDFVRQVGPTCLPIWSSSLSDAAPFTSVAYSPNGTRMASGSDDGTVRIWCAISGEELATISKLSSPIWGLTFSPDGTRLSAGSRDRHLRLWDATSGKEIAPLDTGEARISHLPPVRVAGFRVFDSEIRQEKAKIAKTEWVFSSIVFSRDGKRLACGTEDGIVKIWDAVNGEEIRSFEAHSGAVRSVDFSPDGSRIATGSRDATVKIWDVASSREISKLEETTGELNRVVFSPDGALLACGFDNGMIGLWDVDSEKRIAVDYDETSSDYGPIKSLLFSPDGTRLASSSSGKAMRLLNANDLKILAKLGDDSGWIANIAFSPDGKLLACASPDGAVELWDGVNGRPIATIMEHASQVMSVAFSPDGTRLLSGAEDGNLKLWDVSTDPSADFRQPLNLLALEHKGYLQLVDREVVWAKNPRSPDNSVLAPIHWRNDLVAQLAEAASESERMAISLKMCGQSRKWQSMLSIWQQAKDSGMADHAAVRREFVAQSAVILRLLSSSNKPEFPMDLWLAMLAACEGQDNQDPRLRLAVSEMMRVLFICDDTPENLLLAIADECRKNAFLLDAAASALPINQDNGNRAADQFLKMMQSQDGGSFFWGSAQDRLEWRLAKPKGIVSDDDEAGQNKNTMSTTTAVGYVSTLDSRQPTLGSLFFEGRHGRFSDCGALAVTAGNNVEWGGTGSPASDVERKPLSGRMQAECINIALSKCEAQAGGIGGLMAGIGTDGSAVLWQRDTDLRLEIEADEKISPFGIFLASGGKRWASVDRSGRTLLREFPSGKTVAELYVKAPRPRGVVLAFSTDGRWLVGTNRSQEGIVQIFDAETGNLLRRLEGHKGMVGHVSVSPDGRHVATSSIDGTVRIWEAENGRKRAVLGGHRRGVYKAGFDRAGERVATASGDGRAQVWTLDGEPLREVRIPGDHPVGHAGFSPDGRLLATASKDGRLRLWHAERGDLLFETEVMSASLLDDDMFSPDGNKMVLPTKGHVSVYDGIAGLGAEKTAEDQGGKDDAGVDGKDNE